ncbi:CapA family protein [Lysinibacillus sphaericus]
MILRPAHRNESYTKIRVITMHMNGSIRVIAAGDSFITRRIPSSLPSFKKLAELFHRGDVRFTNLEVTTHRMEGFPSALSGGTWAAADPDVLLDLKAYGFNLIAWANNHTLDYSYGGLEATARYLDQNRFVHAGAGKNLAEANQARYLDTPSGRVALIAATSTFNEAMTAGDQRPDMAGRPGVNPLHYNTVHYLTKEKLNQLQLIEQAANVNDFYEQGVKDGLINEIDRKYVPFGKLLFREGPEEGKATMPSQKDLRRITEKISEAGSQSDYVLISIHSHETGEGSLHKPADFLKVFARACIDAGAHAVIGHGPHVLRGIELYKGRPIFYSLGNFIFQNETVTHLPADFYSKYGLTHRHHVADALDKRSANDTKGYGSFPDAWKTVVAEWTMEHGIVKEIRLHPVELGFGLPRHQRGTPSLSDNEEILKKLAALSLEFHTHIEIENGIGLIRNS